LEQLPSYVFLIADTGVFYLTGSGAAAVDDYTVGNGEKMVARFLCACMVGEYLADGEFSLVCDEGGILENL
jgi:hypothetical protein